MVVEARALVDHQGDTTGQGVPSEPLDDATLQALDALGYEDTAKHVYGMSYGEWKKRHQKKATDEQMQKFQASTPLHAKHDKALLAPRISQQPTIQDKTESEQPSMVPIKESPKQAEVDTAVTAVVGVVPSNVCCEDVDSRALSSTVKSTTTDAVVSGGAETIPVHVPYRAAPFPTERIGDIHVAVLTVSDRAFRDEYKTGDLSGPAIEQVLQQQQVQIQQQGDSNIQFTVVERSIVPDEADAISSQLLQWCGKHSDRSPPMEQQSIDMILTTGGTGMSPRDVTPEATRKVLDIECYGLMSFVLSECSRQMLQPLATLSRGTAGLCNSILIVNLPGNPASVREILPLLLPLLCHAMKHMKS